MSEHGTFGRFRSLARARPPSAGKISASAALSASARRTPRSVAADEVRPEDGLPIRTATLRAAAIGAPITLCYRRAGPDTRAIPSPIEGLAWSVGGPNGLKLQGRLVSDCANAGLRSTTLSFLTQATPATQ